MDEFEYIKGYENLYKINRKGEVMRFKKILTTEINAGYKRVNLSKDGEVKWFSVHRLVALQYIPNPDNLPQIDHIDRDKLNNSVENLRWVSAKENCEHRTNCSKSMTAEQLAERAEKQRKYQREWNAERRRKEGVPKKQFVKDMTPEELVKYTEERRLINNEKARLRRAKKSV